MTDRKIRNARTDRYTPKIEQKKKQPLTKQKRKALQRRKKEQVVETTCGSHEKTSRDNFF
jgi:hypothetical protein